MNKSAVTVKENTVELSVRDPIDATDPNFPREPIKFESRNRDTTTLYPPIDINRVHSLPGSVDGFEHSFTKLTGSGAAGLVNQYKSVPYGKTSSLRLGTDKGVSTEVFVVGGFHRDPFVSMIFSVDGKPCYSKDIDNELAGTFQRKRPELEYKSAEYITENFSGYVKWMHDQWKDVSGRAPDSPERKQFSADIAATNVSGKGVDEIRNQRVGHALEDSVHAGKFYLMLRDMGLPNRSLDDSWLTADEKHDLLRSQLAKKEQNVKEKSNKALHVTEKRYPDHRL